jgi:Helix-turn-helix of insertion element transposase
LVVLVDSKNINVLLPKKPEMKHKITDELQIILELSEDYCLHEKLDPTQIKAIFLLIDGRFTQTQICNELNIDKKTLWTWKNLNQDFKDHFDYCLDEQIMNLKEHHGANLYNAFEEMAQLTRKKSLTKEEFDKGKICGEYIDKVQKNIEFICGYKHLKKQAEEIAKLESEM